MLSGAEVAEEADDDHVVVVSDEGTVLGLLDAEDEDREENVLGADVVRPLQCLLTNVQGQIDQGLLKLLLG